MNKPEATSSQIELNYFLPLLVLDVHLHVRWYFIQEVDVGATTSPPHKSIRILHAPDCLISACNLVLINSSLRTDDKIGKKDGKIWEATYYYEIVKSCCFLLSCFKKEVSKRGRLSRANRAERIACSSANLIPLYQNAPMFLFQRPCK